MPSEKFYDENTNTVVELAWSSTDEYEGVYLTTYEPARIIEGTEKTYVAVQSVLTLDRDDMNRLIRSLRRARNAKYGSDE